MIYGIVYTSNTGFTKRYAQKLSEITQIPLYELNDKSLKKGSKVVYLGWLMAGQLKGYKKAKRKFDIVASMAMALLADEELRGMVPKMVETKIDTWQDIGYYTDENGNRRYGAIPK